MTMLQRDLNLPENLGKDQNERINTLLKVVMLLDWVHPIAVIATEGRYFIERATVDLPQLKLDIVGPEPLEDYLQPPRLASVSALYDQGTRNLKIDLVAQTKDLDKLEQVLRSAVIGLVRPEERDIFRPAYPEPNCYTRHEVGNHPPLRVVTREWLNWHWANKFQTDALVDAFKKILATEFAEPDHATKDWEEGTIQADGGTAINIYHVEKTRV